ncbi:MAG: hypothetical protein KatS3mg001_151 [Candidatus Pacearchaeota archaeon]|nr:MAG: hypothetical protein KatS3mg001_151 [Candidatus Pacearchaeota archaeon]
MAYKDLFPTVKEVGRQLEIEGFIVFGTRAYNQISNNCYEIASSIAEIHGYLPISRKELIDKVYAVRSNRIYGTPLPEDIVNPSPANIVVRSPDNPSTVHLSFEIYGREYNFGPGTREGFLVEMRIPLRKKQIIS